MKSILLVCLLVVISVYSTWALRCGRREILDTCINPCQPTCDSPNPEFCTNRGCRKGCVCRPPLVRNTAGECVCIGQCPQLKVCRDPNAFYNPCGSACIPTCRNRNTLLICTKQCVSGCYCKPGYIMDDVRQKCIPKEFCDCVTCPLNEEFLTSGRDCNQCGGNRRSGNLCLLKFEAKCYCKKGFVRNLDGTCVLPTQCPI